MNLKSLYKHLFFPATLIAAASVAGLAVAEDVLHFDHKSGGSGWNVYEDYDDSEYESEEERRFRELDEKRKELEQEVKSQRKEDFFATGVDVYDKSISRSVIEDQKRKSVRGRK